MHENDNIGRWLATNRKAKGITQEQVAKALGTTKATVSRWEAGKRTIYAYQFIEYCDFLGISDDELNDFVHGG